MFMLQFRENTKASELLEKTTLGGCRTPVKGGFQHQTGELQLGRVEMNLLWRAQDAGPSNTLCPISILFHVICLTSLFTDQYTELAKSVASNLETF